MVLGVENLRHRVAGLIQEIYLFEDEELLSFKKNLSLLHARNSKGEIAMALLRIAHQVLPDFVNNVIENNVQYDVLKLPFKRDLLKGFRRIGRGGTNQVFLLLSEDETSSSMVIKIPHSSVDNPESYTQQQMSEYLEIKQIFAEMPDLVLDEEFLMVHDPRNKLVTGIVVQKFIASSMKDIFTEFSENDLLTMLKESDSLRYSVQVFVDIFNSSKKLQENELDLIGEKNLSIVNTKTGPKLVLMDPHYRGEICRSKENAAKIANRVEYLTGILAKI